MTTIAQTLRSGIAALQGSTGSPRLDAELILAHVLDQRREMLIIHDETVLPEVQIKMFEKLLALRKKGMPIAYILGRRPFFDRQFKVSSHVLIPRPETENLVEAALAWATPRLNSLPNGKPMWIVDVGTGSGVIALTLAAHLPAAEVLAVDVSLAALEIAQENGEGLTNVTYLQSDLLESVVGTFDIICANLPYIATEEMNLLEVAKFEPHVALDGGKDGLVLMRRLLDMAPSHLNTPGLLLMEMGADQGEAMRTLAQQAFPERDIQILKDYGKLDRVLRVEIS